MLIVLTSYALARSAALFVISVGAVQQHQQYSENLLNSIPATLFALFQTALIWRWVRSLSELTMVLEADLFMAGDVVRFSSLALAALQPVLVAAGLIDVEWQKYSSLTPNDWNLLSSLYSGFLYMYNGLAFLSLGLLLLKKWGEADSSDHEGRANRTRVLLIAVVFALMTFARGLGLVLDLFKKSNKDVGGVVSSSWAPPAIFFAEWWSIVLCIFVIPARRPADPPTRSFVGNGSMAMASSRVAINGLASTPKGHR